MLTTKMRWTVSLALLGMIVFVAGCGDAKSAKTSDGAGSTPVADTSGNNDEEGGHNLDGWWCAGHGVPEAECARCDSSLVAGFKAKGDWCEKHDRPESQCFICDSERFEKFAVRYETKTGKRPPKPKN